MGGKKGKKKKKSCKSDNTCVYTHTLPFGQRQNSKGKKKNLTTYLSDWQKSRLVSGNVKMV